MKHITYSNLEYYLFQENSMQIDRGDKNPNDRWGYGRQKKLPKEFQETMLKMFLDKITDGEHFCFIITDYQMESFTKNVLGNTILGPMLVYTSKKFNNANHNYDKDCLTFFLFKKA